MKRIAAFLTAAVCCFTLLCFEGVTGSAAETEKKQLAEVRIASFNNQVPTFDYIKAPSEDLWGISITNNDYINCIVEYYDPNDDTLIRDESAQMKIRGNTTAFLSHKRPYKLKLSKKQSLGTESKTKKWILLRCGTDLKYLFSNWTSSYCGLEWEPEFQYVNLTFNGIYRGCYILTEAVENMNKDLDFDDSGFLVENDAYFWKEEDYFTSEHQDPHFAFTFKKPEAEDLTTEQKETIEKQVTEAIESIVNGGDRDYLSYIDAESFAAWFLARDYLCTADSTGSNMFWYTAKAGDPLKLGPMWDYDANFMGTFGSYFTTYDKDTMMWSVNHIRWLNFGNSLFAKPSFMKLYRDRYEKTRNICTDLTAYVNDYIAQYGDALQEAWNRDAVRWETTPGNVQEEKEMLLDFYRTRFDYIGKKTDTWSLDYSDYYRAMASAERIDPAEYENYSLLEEAMKPDVYALDLTQEMLDKITDDIRGAVFSLIPLEDAQSGDLNGDSRVDLKDVVLLRRLIAGGWDVSAAEAVSDVSGDGRVDLKDAVLLRRRIAGGWDAPSAS